MSREPEVEAYFKEAASWERDRVAQARRTVRLLSFSSVLGWLSALAACAGLALLSPLKTVEPFVVRVDNSTGVVDVVPAYDGGASIAEAVTRYLLTHYVQTCERFNFATAESDYEECAAFHTPQMNQAWYARWNKSNPASPLNVYKDGTTVRAQVKAVSFFERSSGVADLAQVRYLTAKRTAGGSDEQVAHWITTLQYAYVEPSTDAKVRRWNPLGLRIVDFRPEPEIDADALVASRSAGEPEAGSGAPTGVRP